MMVSQLWSYWLENNFANSRSAFLHSWKLRKSLPRGLLSNFTIDRSAFLSIEFLKKFPPLLQIVQQQGGKFLKGCKISKIFASGDLPKHWFLMVLGIFRGFKTPKIFACGDPNPSHGLSVVLQCLNLKKPCLWRASGACILCETVFKRCFHQCRNVLLLFVNWFTPRADTTFEVFTSVGVRFYYSQNSLHRALTRF